jgi:hypothetical protein
MASVVKAAGFAGLVRVFSLTLDTYRLEWRPIIYGLAALSLLVGAFSAVVQSNVKRMLAFSSINHAGFLLVGVHAGLAGTSSVLFYLISYTFMVAGSFGIDALAWVREATERGVGEILLNSMDADGTKDGFDVEMIAAVRARTTVPLIASGGAGAVEHFVAAVEAGADAVLAASVFHFGDLTIGDVKAALRSAGHEVR